MKKTIASESKAPSLRPLSGYLLVEPSEAETQTASGIFLPDSSKEKPAQGKVIAVGPDMFLGNGMTLPSPVAVGDVVVYKKWGGDEIKLSGVEYKLVKFEDLMGVIE